MARFAFVFLLALVIAVQSSTALTCANCNVDCQIAFEEDCPEAGPDQKISCLTETFTDQEGKTQYQRKCVLYDRKIGKFQCADYPGYKTVGCLTCDTDMCNRAPPGGDRAKNATLSNATV